MIVLATPNGRKRRYAVRPIRVEGDVAYVPLTRGMEAIIDAADVPLVSDFNWCSRPFGNSVLVQRGSRQTDSCRRGHVIYLYRQILGDEAAPGMVVDHRNGNGLDNRRANLRVATSRQNRANSASFNVMGKGVSKSGTRFSASIQVDRRVLRLGSFGTAQEAAAAYAGAAAVIHGEFALHVSREAAP